MKLTKETLKRLIKEELTKEARRRVAPHPSTLPQGMEYKGPEYIDVPSRRPRRQRQPPLSDEEMANEAVSLGQQISSLFDDMDLDKSTLLQEVENMYKDFRELVKDYVAGDGISESRRRSRR